MRGGLVRIGEWVAAPVCEEICKRHCGLHACSAVTPLKKSVQVVWPLWNVYCVFFFILCESPSFVRVSQYIVSVHSHLYIFYFACAISAPKSIREKHKNIEFWEWQACLNYVFFSLRCSAHICDVMCGSVWLLETHTWGRLVVSVVYCFYGVVCGDVVSFKWVSVKFQVIL